MNAFLLDLGYESAFREKSAIYVKNREKTCGTPELCCAGNFLENHFTNVAYQSRGTVHTVICDCNDGRVWSHNRQ